MDIDAIRQVSIIDFLNHLGHQPTGRDSKGYWFYAPYRSERKPSLHVIPASNRWYDFGTGAGGDIFELAGAMSGETDFVRQAAFIAEKMSLPCAEPFMPLPKFQTNNEPVFENVEISRLDSPSLLRYLAQRGIPREIAQKFCVRVDYQLHGLSRSAFGTECRKNEYYAIGFENNAHGFELRSPFFKGSYPPKHITHLAHGNPRCNVFEGFIDFLSAERLGYNDGNDALVLNSVSNLNKALSPLADYSVIACYLDNDHAGRTALAKLEAEFGLKVMDKSSLYPNHKDLNDYLVSITPKQSKKLKL